MDRGRCLEGGTNNAERCLTYYTLAVPNNTAQHTWWLPIQALAVVTPSYNIMISPYHPIFRQ